MRKLAGVFAVFLCCATALAADFTGTWKLNLQKSKMRNPNLTAETIVIQKTGPNSYHTTIDDTTASGEKYHRTYDRIYDGKEHAGGSSNASAAHSSEICEFLPGRARKITMKTDGKVTTTIHSTLSADGQTLTNLREDAEGKDVMVFDREK